MGLTVVNVNNHSAARGTQRKPGGSQKSSAVREHTAGYRVIFILLSIFLAARTAVGQPRLSGQTRAALRASGIVGRRVVDALDQQDKVRVVIAFRMPQTSRTARRALSNRVLTKAAIRSTSRAILRRFAAGEFRIRRSYQAINALVGDVNASGALKLLRDPNVLRVDVDEATAAHLVEAVPLVRLDKVHTAGFTGKGVTVAVLDTGIDRNHPDLSDSVIDEHCFCSQGGGCCPNGSSMQSGAGSGADDNGHGTNVAGIISSNGTVAPLGGAPDAKIVAVKVLDSGNTGMMSDVCKALDWIVNNRADVNLVNVSIGSLTLYSGECDGADANTMALTSAINALNASGVTVFASTGNNGSSTQMSAPACIANAISVAAVWDSNVGTVTANGCTDTTTQADQITCFSNTDSKTDLLAPGAPTTSTGIGGGTSIYYGTSQASPLAAACAATLLQKYPGLLPGQIELGLKVSTTNVTDPRNGLSFPRVNCEEALARVTPFLSFPLPNRTADSVSVNSVFDHYMLTPYATGGIRTVAYTGEEGRNQCGQDPGFTKAAFRKFDSTTSTCGGDFIINDHYTGEPTSTTTITPGTTTEL